MLRIFLSLVFPVLNVLMLFSPAAANSGVVSEYNSGGLSFSIVLPQDWDVVHNASGLELFAEPKVKATPSAANPVVADPNITVAASKNPMPIDQDSLEKYALQISLGLQKSLGESANSEIFLKRLITIKNNRPALLYYLRYKKGQFDVYNAIVVASTATHLFRVTLTDYSVSFDANLEKLFPYISSLDVGTGSASRPDILKVATPWIGGAIAFLILLVALNAVRLRLSQTQLSGALSESVYEQRNSKHPFSKPVEFKGSEMGEDYDPEFRQSSEASRYHGDENFTEVPLSQAIGSGAAGSYVSREQTRGKGSVVDPETEVSGFSGGFSRSEGSSISSTRSRADTSSSFAVSQAPSESKHFKSSRGETTETKKITPPPPPLAGGKPSPRTEVKTSASRLPVSEPKSSSHKASSAPASSGFGLDFSKGRDDDEV